MPRWCLCPKKNGRYGGRVVATQNRIFSTSSDKAKILLVENYRGGNAVGQHSTSIHMLFYAHPHTPLCLDPSSSLLLHQMDGGNIFLHVIPPPSRFLPVAPGPILGEPICSRRQRRQQQSQWQCAHCRWRACCCHWPLTWVLLLLMLALSSPGWALILSMWVLLP